MVKLWHIDNNIKSRTRHRRLYPRRVRSRIGEDEARECSANGAVHREDKGVKNTEKIL